MLRRNSRPRRAALGGTPIRSGVGTQAAAVPCVQVSEVEQYLAALPGVFPQLLVEFLAPASGAVLLLRIPRRIDERHARISFFESLHSRDILLEEGLPARPG